MAFWISLLESDADLVAATTVAGRPFSTATTIELHRFASLGLKSRIDARKRGVNRQNHALILKSGPEIKNHCSKKVINRENRAAIPKFTP